MFQRTIIYLTLLLLSCTEEKIVPGTVPELPTPPGANVSPSNFVATIDELSDDHAILEWGPVYDRDNDPLYSTVYLNGSVVTSLTNDFVFNITGLKPETEYTGKVVVTDSISTPKETVFNFTTKKHFIRFNKLYDNYAGKIPEGFSMTKTNDGGYLVAGDIGFGQNGGGLFVLKLDSLGYEQWHTEIEAHRDIAFDGAVIQTKDYGFVIVNQRAITKLNSSGILLWQQSTPIWYQFYNSVVETNDLGYLVVGMIGGPTPARGTITKFNKNGIQQWEKYFDSGTVITMSGCSQIVKGPGNYYTVAGGHQKPNAEFELALARIDELGNIYWTKIYNHAWEILFGRGIKLKAAGDGFILGTTSLQASGPDYARMVKVDENGSLVWDHTFLWGGYETFCRSINALQDGNFLFVGGYNDLSFNETAIIVKINSSGELLWKKDYTPDYDDFVWEFKAVEQTADRGFALMGFKAWIWSGDGKEKGLWFMKTDDNGE